MKKRKALAFITRRNHDGEMQLLLHEHVDFPEAGVQVPAGTIEEGESPIQAAKRESMEEVGIGRLKYIKTIGTYDYCAEYDNNNIHERHIIHFHAPSGGEDRWDHRVSSGGFDKGLLFRCYWKNLKSIGELAGDQHIFLDKIRIEGSEI